MKIGILIDNLRVGGVEKIALLQTCELSKRGHDVTLLVLHHSPVPDALKDLAKGQKIIYLDDRMPSLVRMSIKIPGFSFLSLYHLTYPVVLRRWKPKVQVDVLLCHATFTAFSGVTLANLFNCPLVTVIHDPLTYIWKHVYTVGKWARFLKVFSWGIRAVDRWICRRSDYIFATSIQHAEWLAALGEAAKVTLMPYGVYPTSRPSMTRDNTFIAATSWKRGKRIEDLIQIFSKYPNLRLDIIGSWLDLPYLAEIETQIRTLGLGDQIRLLGAASEEAMANAYGRALCAIVVNEEAGFGLSVLEAAAQGCTFIAPDSCGASRYFDHGIHGLFYQFGDLGKMESLVTDFAFAPQMAIDYGLVAWREVRTYYSWEHQSQELEAMLMDVVSSVGKSDR